MCRLVQLIVQSVLCRRLAGMAAAVQIAMLVLLRGLLLVRLPMLRHGSSRRSLTSHEAARQAPEVRARADVLQHFCSALGISQQLLQVWLTKRLRDRAHMRLG